MRVKFGIVLAALPLCMQLTACSCSNKQNADVAADIVYREDYRSVYGAIGQSVTIDMVQEKADGSAYVVLDGVEYELGMDFLSMAMVYNTKPSGKFSTSEAVYNEWWRLYIQRWNMLAPEAPLYSNQYYDVYNAKIALRMLSSAQRCFRVKIP